MDPTVDPETQRLRSGRRRIRIFPLQNLPWGVFAPRQGERPRCGVRIGDHGCST